MQGGDEEENAAALKFGKDFDGVHCLTNAEVAVILSRQKTVNQKHDINVTSTFSKTMAYVTRYGGSEDMQAIFAATSELREALQNFEGGHDGKTVRLHQFEIASLGNLMQADSTAEEAIALVPSLGNKFDEDEIEAILDIIKKNHHQARLYG